MEISKERVQKLCKNKGLTVSALCRLVDRQSGYLRDIWDGRNHLPYEKMLEIAKALNTTPEYLREETDDPERKVSVLEEDRIKFALFNGAVDVTDEEYEEVKKYAQYVLSRRGQ